MRACIAVVFLLVVLSASVEAFISSFKQARKHATIAQNKQVLLAKPDLFSGEFFIFSPYQSVCMNLYMHLFRLWGVNAVVVVCLSFFW